MNAPAPLPPREVVVRLVPNPDPLRIDPWRGLRALARFAEERAKYENPPIRPEPDDALACPS